MSPCTPFMADLSSTAVPQIIQVWGAKDKLVPLGRGLDVDAGDPAIKIKSRPSAKPLEMDPEAPMRPGGPLRYAPVLRALL